MTNRTPLDYATEKQFNYCALLLSNAQQGGEVGSVCHYCVCSIRVFYHTRTDQGQFTFTSAQPQGQSPVCSATIFTVVK